MTTYTFLHICIRLGCALQIDLVFIPLDLLSKGEALATLVKSSQLWHTQPQLEAGTPTIMRVLIQQIRIHILLNEHLFMTTVLVKVKFIVNSLYNKRRLRLISDNLLVLLDRLFDIPRLRWYNSTIYQAGLSTWRNDLI